MVMVKLKRQAEADLPTGNQGLHSLTPPPPRKRKRDSEGSGCRIVILLFLLVLVAIVVAIIKGRDLYTNTQPAFVSVPRIPATVNDQAKQKVAALRQSAELNAVISVTFTEAELNALLQNAIKESGWEGTMAITLDNKLHLTHSSSVGGIPGFAGRHLNGQSTFDLRCRNGKPTVDWVYGAFNNHKLPAFVRQRLAGPKLARKILAIPRLSQFVDQIAELRIDNGSLHITTRKTVPGTGDR